LLPFAVLPPETRKASSVKVWYQNNYHDIDSGNMAHRMRESFGDQMELFIQDSFYKKTYSGKNQPRAIYRGDENRLYYFDNSNDTIRWLSAGSDSLSRIMSFKKIPSDEEILGYKCKGFQIKSENVTITYFYSESMGVTFTGFERHKLDHWYLYVDNCKSVPLKVVTEFQGAIMTSVATRIQIEDGEDDEFAIPPGRPLKRLGKK
jgi:hypothetical protein